MQKLGKDGNNWLYIANDANLLLSLEQWFGEIAWKCIFNFSAYQLLDMQPLEIGSFEFNYADADLSGFLDKPYGLRKFTNLPGHYGVLFDFDPNSEYNILGPILKAIICTEEKAKAALSISAKKLDIDILLLEA